MQCITTLTGHHWGKDVCRLPEHTLHVRSHRGGWLYSQLWTQCVECQSSGSGGEILTTEVVGEK